MSITQNPEAELMEKIRSLPPDKITVLKKFIDFLLTRSEAGVIVDTATKLSEAAFAKIWDNPEVRIQVFDWGIREGMKKSQQWADRASRKKAIALLP